MQPSLKAQQYAARAVFLVLGWSVGAWAPMVPLIKAKFGLAEDRLGALLLCIGIGSLLALPFSGSWAAKFGCRRVLVVSCIGCSLAVPAAAVIPNQLMLGLVLGLFGAAVGVTDVVINIQAVTVERDSERPMMSGFHGLFSAGGVVGAAVSALLLGRGISMATVANIAGVAMFAATLYAAPGLLTTAEKSEGPVFAWPKGRVLALGLMCFALFMAEGSVTDWGGVLLRDWRHWADSRAGLGYIAFSIAMTIGRLSGDWLVALVGRLRTVVLGSSCTAAGFLLAATSPSPVVGVIGFGLVGAGAANVVPVLFTAAGKQASMPSHLAIPAVTSLGYVGFLVGPALIGVVAKNFTLPVALSLVGFLLAAVALAAPFYYKTD